MHRLICLGFAWGMLALGIGTASAAPEPASSVGRQLPELLLSDLDGQPASLSDFNEYRCLVVVILGTECPIGNQYLPVLNEMQEKYAEQSVQFVGVNVNRGDTLEEMAQHRDEFKIAFPVFKDPQGLLADFLGVRRMSEAFVLDGQRVVRYQGRIDDRFGYTYKRDDARAVGVWQALEQVLAGEEVATPRTKVAGCLITPPKRERPEGEITYAEHIAPIMRQKCESCHRPGMVAPFSLLTYDDAVNWAAMIEEVVQERRMPPWHADPRHGDFRNDRRLSQKEIDTLTAWIQADTPLGDESKLPPPKDWAQGWAIGKPDIVFEMPEEVTIPAQGVVPYQYFETEMDFEEDVWIQAAEARPGNRAVVHHIIGFYREPEAEGKDRGERLTDNWIVGTAPGDMPLILPEGVALRIPAGSKLIWQMHYTPTGKEEKDRSQIGLVLYKGEEPPQHLVHKVAIANGKFRIPPGARYHQVTSKRKIPKDVQILSLMPHMHLRGRAFDYYVRFPDGSRETLLSIPRYDFNWQSSYYFKDPLTIPAGSTLECVAHFDNSEDNPANPDPTQEVRWGDQTFEEMMIGYCNYIVLDEEGPKADQRTAAAAGSGRASP